jgi:serine/threonine protein kinase
VALKVIQYSNATNPEKAALDVEREATALKRLTHPSIVSVLECDHDKDAQNAVLTMEWAETSLAEESGTLIDLRDLMRQRQNERFGFISV